MSDSRPAPTAQENEKKPGPVSRWFAALLAASLGALLVAAFETAAAAGQNDGHGGYLGQLGLVAPFALMLGAVFGALALALGRQGRVGITAVLEWDRASVAARRRIVAIALCLLPLSLLWLVGGARLGLDALLDGSASRLALGGLGISLSWVLCVGAAVGIAEPLSRRLPASVKPTLFVFGVAALLVAAVVTLARFGTTSGAGGAFSMFGVLSRDELDLRAPGYLLLISVLAFQLPSWLARLPYWGSAAAALALAATPALASSTMDDPSLSLATERATALSKTGLVLMRRFTDADGDGFAPHFGGGDCDDARADINPTADDVPQNGIDEDCSGADAEPFVPLEQEEAEPLQGEGSANEIPEELNLVFISIDTLRYDISFTGYERKITPNIDALAARSVYYDNAYALASYTSKSLGPTLIGRYGSETHRGKRHFSIFEPIDKMVQERLTAAGIRTVSVQGHWYFKENTGLGRGFDVLDLSAMPEERQGEGDRTINSDKITDAALKQLDALVQGKKRFYLWVHYLDPHAEYVPHEGFDFGESPRDLYDGEVAFTDHHVGRLLTAIAESPAAANTAIVVTSDHGESFGAHGMMRHGFELWDVLIRVPLLIYAPGVKPKRVTARRSLIDLTPTFLDLYGLDVPTRKDEDFLSGRSMLPDLKPEAGQLKHRPIFVDMPGGPFVPERQAYINLDGQKIITSKLRPMGVYDLNKDAGEEQNLIKDVERTKAALEEMKQFRRQFSRVRY